MNDSLNARLAVLPSLDRLLQDPRVQQAVAAHGRAVVVEALRALLAGRRELLKRRAPAELSADAIVEELALRLAQAARPSMRRVFNLTGTVLHTNLGRALLPPAAVEAAGEAQAQACNLEFDLEDGSRGERDAHVERLLCRLTGAEAATVLNNNAGAVFLALNTLACGKDVPVSRGELVEIGGSFRVPEIIAAAGCRLREVGTTNRTHLRDYERVLEKGGAAAVLRVHASNYAIVGFVASPADAELAKLAHAHRLPFISDLGSGSLVDLRKWGLPAEPTPTQALRAGADLVAFSGDKLLGGPQAGIVVGKRRYVERLRKNPLKRALRLDKGRLAALEAVLRLYLDPDRLAERLPTLRLLTRQQAVIEAAARRLAPVMQKYCGESFVVDVAPCASQIGSGSLPVERLPSAALRIRLSSRNLSSGKVTQLATGLRRLPIPVIGRVHAGALWLDLRCLEDEADEAAFAAQLEGAGR
jgi:L-seryl-tRNA(Ser) seleniumtransferase